METNHLMNEQGNSHRHAGTGQGGDLDISTLVHLGGEGGTLCYC